GKDAEAAVTAGSEPVSKKQSEIDKAKEVYSVYSAFEENDTKKNANVDTINKNDARFAYDADTDTYKEKDGSGAEVAIGQGVVAKEVTDQFDKKVAVAQDMMDPAKRNALKEEAKNMATKVDGEDALIEVDGVEYRSSDDNLTVNGMTITAIEVTDKPVTVTTKNDTEGVYNMIKDFIKAYSELINEMDSLYNAESSKGYEPLLTEEKDALSDNEIEEWEKKIKDSILRRDSTLRDVSSAMKMDMMKGFSIGGQMIYLSDFGIETLGYFNAPENEKNAYHINGDPDDPKTKNNTDKLTALINNNPEAVMDFFTKLTDTLHNTLQDKMSATKMSSAMTFYNDKKMKEDYNDYTDKIKKQEDKLNAYIDNWYAKFSKMETALAKLESKNNSLSSLFGG
ncbi:MAG: flagellar filament capping protein FliD, partial [Lachnospiraceae bacterium]|nr:flagellar filament capping protein FliD [Lachnospiraceae bacterium]